MARVQGLIAAARGDRELAAARLQRGRRRLARAARGARAAPASSSTSAAPPVAGLVEPDRELARVERELAAPGAVTAPRRA